MRIQLYTVILEFQGGTYISQVLAPSPQESARLYTQYITKSDADAWKLDVSKLRALFRDCEPVPLKELINAWCVSGEIDGHFVLMNIIQTDRCQLAAIEA
jgi:hypothetical protein